MCVEAAPWQGPLQRLVQWHGALSKIYWFWERPREKTDQQLGLCQLLAASCVTLELVLIGQGQVDKALYSLAGPLPLQKEAQGNTKEGTLPCQGPRGIPYPVQPTRVFWLLKIWFVAWSSVQSLVWHKRNKFPFSWFFNSQLRIWGRLSEWLREMEMYSEDCEHRNKLTIIINCDKQYSGDESTFIGLKSLHCAN